MSYAKKIGWSLSTSYSSNHESNLPYVLILRFLYAKPLSLISLQVAKRKVPRRWNLYSDRRAAREVCKYTNLLELYSTCGINNQFIMCRMLLFATDTHTPKGIYPVSNSMYLFLFISWFEDNYSIIFSFGYLTIRSIYKLSFQCHCSLYSIDTSNLHLYIYTYH
jgi:hypothetical protein